MELNREQIKQAYENLKIHTATLFSVTEIEIKAKRELEVRRLSLLAEGAITGKNAEEREACARRLLDREYKALEIAEKNTRTERTSFELARLDVECLRALLRLAEIEARAGELPY
jgi:cell division protein FtsL